MNESRPQTNSYIPRTANRSEVALDASLNTQSPNPSNTFPDKSIQQSSEGSIPPLGNQPPTHTGSHNQCPSLPLDGVIDVKEEAAIPKPYGNGLPDHLQKQHSALSIPQAQATTDNPTIPATVEPIHEQDSGPHGENITTSASQSASANLPVSTMPASAQDSPPSSRDTRQVPESLHPASVSMFEHVAQPLNAPRISTQLPEGHLGHSGRRDSIEIEAEEWGRSLLPSSNKTKHQNRVLASGCYVALLIALCIFLPPLAVLIVYHRTRPWRFFTCLLLWLLVMPIGIIYAYFVVFVTPLTNLFPEHVPKGLDDGFETSSLASYQKEVRRHQDQERFVNLAYQARKNEKRRRKNQKNLAKVERKHLKKMEKDMYDQQVRDYVKKNKEKDMYDQQERDYVKKNKEKDSIFSDH